MAPITQTVDSHGNKVDFIKRFFAVAISVGFASTISKMDWLQDAKYPTRIDWDQIAILIVGLAATVLSWDGYLASVSKKPLIGEGRYIIDIALVFLYMTLLMTSEHSALWLPIIVIIFALYLLWDALSVREYLDKYDLAKTSFIPGSDRASFPAIARVYIGGLRDDPAIDRGPIISVCWFLFFAALALANTRPFPFHHVQTMAVLALCGLWFYREDKRLKRENSSGELVRGYTRLERGARILPLMAITFAIAYLT